MQQTLQVTKDNSMTARQIASILAQKTDLELKEEFPVFWELLRIRKKRIRLEQQLEDD
ncbi:MAG: hypothetical protein V1777_03835 [Candidatus Micrarchaeota archaeon]